MSSSYFTSLYTCVRLQVMGREEKWFLLNDEHEGSGKMFVGYLKVFSDKNARTLNVLHLWCTRFM